MLFRLLQSYFLEVQSNIYTYSVYLRFQICFEVQLCINMSFGNEFWKFQLLRQTAIRRPGKSSWNFGETWGSHNNMTVACKISQSVKEEANLEHQGEIQCPSFDKNGHVLREMTPLRLLLLSQFKGVFNLRVTWMPFYKNTLLQISISSYLIQSDWCYQHEVAGYLQPLQLLYLR